MLHIVRRFVMLRPLFVKFNRVVIGVTIVPGYE